MATPAWADPAQEAREHFRKGTQLYDLGKHLDAAAEYQKAFELSDLPGFLFNIGQAYRLGGKSREALSAYVGFLRRVPDSAQRSEVELHVAALRQTIAEEERIAAEEARAKVAREQAEAAEKAATTLVTSPPQRIPLYKKWWLWTAVGAVVVVGVGVGVGLAFGLPPTPTFPKSNATTDPGFRH